MPITVTLLCFRAAQWRRPGGPSSKLDYKQSGLSIGNSIISAKARMTVMEAAVAAASAVLMIGKGCWLYDRSSHCRCCCCFTRVVCAVGAAPVVGSFTRRREREGSAAVVVVKVLLLLLSLLPQQAVPCAVLCWLAGFVG